MQITQESSEKMEDVMKSIQMKEKVKDKKTVEQMKILKKLNESFQSTDGDIDTSTVNDINNVLGDTKIGKIAKKISEDINKAQSSMTSTSNNKINENRLAAYNRLDFFENITLEKEGVSYEERKFDFKNKIAYRCKSYKSKYCKSDK